MLETAAHFDTATGGFRAPTAIFPQVMRVVADGITSVDEQALGAAYELAELGR